MRAATYNRLEDQISCPFNQKYKWKTQTFIIKINILGSRPQSYIIIKGLLFVHKYICMQIESSALNWWTPFSLYIPHMCTYAQAQSRESDNAMATRFVQILLFWFSQKISLYVDRDDRNTSYLYIKTQSAFGGIIVSASSSRWSCTHSSLLYWPYSLWLLVSITLV